MRRLFRHLLAASLSTVAGHAIAQTMPSDGQAQQLPSDRQTYRIYQQPTLGRDLIAFTYGGDIWTVPRAGGRATRLTTGVGQETAPVFSPDGTTIAFTGDYDGNIDVFTVPATGGVPKRITWHPGADVVTGWSPDGKKILFRSDRTAASRYTQMFMVDAAGGPATALPLPTAYAGQLSPDGKTIAYNPLPPASGFELNRYVSWGNYRGGRIGTIWLTRLDTLDSGRVPQAGASDFSPVFLGGKVYFLSNRNGPASIFSFDPADGKVAEIYHNTQADIRTLATDGQALIFDRLGEIFLLQPGTTPQRVPIVAEGDMPDVRPRIANVSAEIQNVALSPSGQRVAVEAHGEILTVPAKSGPSRNITNSAGVMEREPAWSPDGRWLAYFSDESGHYALHVAPQSGEGPVRKFSLGQDDAFYFKPRWSPDSTKIAFHDNRLRAYILDRKSGTVTTIRRPGPTSGTANTANDMAWSPDSRWLAFTQTTANSFNALFLWSLDKGRSTQITEPMANARFPAFDPRGDYLFFLASNNSGGALQDLDMSSDLYMPTSSVYALTLRASTPSPIAPQSDEENPSPPPSPPGLNHTAPRAASSPVRPLDTDLGHLPLTEIARRTVALPIPARPYSDLAVGKPGMLYFIETIGRADDPANAERVLDRFDMKERKVEKLAEQVGSYALTLDGEKMLLVKRPAPSGQASGTPPRKPEYAIVPAGAAAKAGEGSLALDGLEIRIDPRAEWAQMYREVWRIQRAYFYDPGFHGLDIAAAEKRYQPYVAAVQARSDLDYVFQEALTNLSVGHLRGWGGTIPAARRVPGGLLGADYIVRDNRWCIAKIYPGTPWSPEVTAPLTQPGLDIREGDCILAIDGRPVIPTTDIQAELEGTAGRMVVLKLARSGVARDVGVVPTANEGSLRNLAWIEDNRRRVEALSGGKLAYLYLPDTAYSGFAAFNRYYFAQTEKQGAIIDERYNAGGQVADYFIDVLGRRLQSWWARRQGPIQRTPAHAILGPKVMIANEMSGSGGDALPWMFKHNGLGPLVGKRTWGGLVGIASTPVLMDGAQVSAPAVGFFNTTGQWDVENHGVEPDYVIEQDPKAIAAGHDPQLETAVTLAMQRLAADKAPVPVLPAFPVYPAPTAPQD